MNLKPISYNGHVFASNNMNAFVPDGPVLAYPATAVISERGGTTPASIDRRYTTPVTTAIQIQFTGNVSEESDQVELIRTWFQTISPLAGLDANFGTLIAEDLDDSNRQWILLCAPLTVTKDMDSVIIVLLAREPYWKIYIAETASWNITASGQTKVFTAVGVKARPVFTITITSPRLNANNHRFVDIQPPSTTVDMGMFPLDIGGGINTATLVAAGKCQADGDDFRVWVDGAEVSRFFGTTFNTTATKVWVTLPWKPKVTLPLGTAIAGAGDVPYLQFAVNATTQDAFSKMGNNGIIKIGSEYFVYSAKDDKTGRLIGKDGGNVARAAKLSSAAAHSAGATCTWIQHDIWIVYGNAAQTAPIDDITKKPPFDLDTSTNASWVFTSFGDSTNPGQVMRWLAGQTLSISKYSHFYNITQNVRAGGPITDMGMWEEIHQNFGQWRAETVTIWWQIVCPALFTSITASGKAYRNYTGGYPTTAAYKSTDGENFSLIANVPAATAISTWEAWSFGPTSLSGGQKVIKFMLSGTVPPSPSTSIVANTFGFEVAAVTLVPDSSITPAISVGAESSQYALDCVLSNGANNQAIGVTLPVKLNKPIIIDCEKRRAYMDDNTPIQGAVRRVGSKRTEWMTFEQGDNTVTFTDDDTVGLTIAESHNSRAPLKT